jgi:hypothetical protein
MDYFPTVFAENFLFRHSGKLNHGFIAPLNDVMLIKQTEGVRHRVEYGQPFGFRVHKRVLFM